MCVCVCVCVKHTAAVRFIISVVHACLVVQLLAKKASERSQNTAAIVPTWARRGQVTVAQALLFKDLRNQVWLRDKTPFIEIPAHYIEPTVSYSAR